MDGTWAAAYRSIRGIFSPSEMGMNIDVADIDHKFGSHQAEDAADIVTLLELAHYLPKPGAPRLDQTSMAHSIELRLPILDDVVVQTALSLPTQARVTQGKSVLAQAADTSAYLPKQPFSVPLDAWLRGPLRTFAGGGSPV